MVDKFHFTTVVSSGHFFKFLTMYTSLEKYCDSFTLYVLCANDEVYDMLSLINFPHIEPVKLSTIESVENELLQAKKDRIFHAYCWTLKPVFLYYVLMYHPDAHYFAHLDADLCFFSDPSTIFDENKNASLYLTHHRNSEMFWDYYNVTGIYNTGFVGCGNDETARKAVSRWRKQCIENCPIKEDVEKKLFGDQRYVENWPYIYNKVHVVETPGANAALWNILDYDVTVMGSKVYINENPLVFYHFSGLSIINENEFNICWYYHIDKNEIIAYIYLPYLFQLRGAIIETKKRFSEFNEGFYPKEASPNTHFIKLE